MDLSADDVAHLRRCVELAERGARTAQPNPVVGCVIERDGRVLGEGWHVRPGGDHAEVAALKAAGAARGATAFVSLEPCCHHGRTPPCTDALAAAGVVRVVVAVLDPSPKVDGRGAAALRASGIAVDVAEPGAPVAVAARRQQAPFRALALLGRPHVTYKAAVSLDGRTAAAGGDARWISSPESRRLVHEWRARSGAVAVGIGTALQDDPQLTARDVEPPAERQPLRVVFDRRGRLPVDGALARSAHELPVLVVCREDAPGRAGLEAAGVETFAGSPAEALAELGRRRIASVLLEGGGRLAGSLLCEGLVDRMAVVVAPMLLGDGPGLLEGLSAPTVADAVSLSGLRAAAVGPDILLEAEVREV